MKLIIQIPCFNERDQLRTTLADLPHKIPGIDSIEVLIIDDGSTDGTSEVAEHLGVHHIVRFPQNRGLSAAYFAGLEASLILGADIIVNTDADNQYCGGDIEQLVDPIISERADIVIGNRQTKSIPHFSLIKRILQHLGSGVVRRVSGVQVADATSGFRAMSNRAASRMFVHNTFSYTLETIIQAGKSGLAIENVNVRTNPRTRESRLFNSIPAYLRHSVPTIFRVYAMYWPLKAFSFIGISCFGIGVALIARFLYFYIRNPEYSGHIQSLLGGVGAVILAFVVGLMAMLSDLIAGNRRLIEATLAHVRRLNVGLQSLPGAKLSVIGDQLRSTDAKPWLGEWDQSDEAEFVDTSRALPNSSVP